MTEEISSLISKIDSLLLLDKHLKEANRDFMKPEASLELVDEIEKLLDATQQRTQAFYDEIKKLGQKVATGTSSRCDVVTANNLNTIEQDMGELNALVAHIINYERATPNITAELKQGFANVGQAYANVCTEYVRFINFMMSIPNAIYSDKDGYNRTKLGSLIADKKIEDYKQQLLRNGQQVNNVLGENNNG